ncbi:hypothetical protein R1sor_003409 [Riccia sorocarpa]|uniref:Uncharacterized protein n=1 Tax=Riccia sorocarpa TaxID=122646 RepID=A0ABD3H4H5_9MARC
MRDRAASEDTPIPRIYQEEANHLASSESASAMLPVLQSLDTSLYRARRQLPPLPRSLADVVIPESLRFTEAGEDFVFEQCTSVRERLQIGAGQQVQRTLVRYVRVNQRLDNLRDRYATGNVDILEYLTKVGRIIANRRSIGYPS